ncbi:MAG TPA: enoyl-CoA hydratase/isomerase family protein [Myxococcota bacterium]|nr:enoyl-CoA hydratase/isomerase family protein [Myxococcota bacterium]HQK52573.1 enoyl-CoA hydratase/isomerase family protein [Myxococcota bacterium]
MEVRLERDGDLGRIVLDRPPRNTLDDPVFVDPGRLEAFWGQEGIRGIVLVGSGRHFCGGADLEALRQRLPDPESLARSLDAGKALLDRIRDAPVPVVAAISGQCLGAGLEIALACHARVAASGAMLGFPESDLGLMPGLGGTLELGNRISRSRRVEWILTGRLIGAEEALEWGLVDAVVPAGRLEEEARGLVRRWVSDRTPLQVRAILESVGNAWRRPREEALRRETELFLELAREVAT